MQSLRNELEVRECHEADELEELRPDWAALWEASPQATPFQSPAWLLPWWRRLGQGELRFLSAWHDRELCGVAPFYIYPQPVTHTKQLLLLGSGNSDYLDVL